MHLGGSTATLTYQHTDALGSPVATTNSAKSVLQRSEYEPYGYLLNRPMEDGPGYTGHVTDAATGLVYMQQRYYDPLIGQHFLSVDPVTAYSPGGAFNQYWYAKANPYGFVDLDGRDPGDPPVSHFDCPECSRPSLPALPPPPKPKGCDVTRTCWQDDNGKWHFSSDGTQAQSESVKSKNNNPHLHRNIGIGVTLVGAGAIIIANVVGAPEAEIAEGISYVSVGEFDGVAVMEMLDFLAGEPAISRFLISASGVGVMSPAGVLLGYLVTTPMTKGEMESDKQNDAKDEN
jgi:RHS repeat-associated protein